MIRELRFQTECSMWVCKGEGKKGYRIFIYSCVFLKNNRGKVFREVPIAKGVMRRFFALKKSSPMGRAKKSGRICDNFICMYLGHIPSQLSSKGQSSSEV